MILLKLLGLWRWLKEAFSALLGIVRRYPLQTALIASLCLAGWMWQARNAERAKVSDLTAQIMSERAAYASAQAEAKRLAIAAKEAQEAIYRAKAKDADNAYQLALANSRSAADRYAAANRVRPETACCSPGGTVAPAEVGSAGVSEKPAPDAIMVSQADFNALNDAAIYAMAAHEWAKGLE